MAVDEKARLELRNKLKEVLGPRVADIAMEAMPPLDYQQLATKTDVANLGVELRGEIARLDGKITGLNSKIDGKITGLDAKIEALDSSLNGRIEALDSSLTAAMDKLESRLGLQLAADRRTMLVSVFGMILAMGGFIVGFG